MVNPFIPLKYADIVIIDGRVSEEIINNLKSLNIKTIIPTIKCKDVDDSISFHPDIVMHPINHDTLIVAPNVFDYYDEKLKGMGIKLIKGTTNLNREYPLDIAYNIGRVDNYAFHKIEYTDQVVKSHFKNEKIEMIDIKQGYSKCSMAIINNSSIITSDNGIYAKLVSLGIDALLIDSGHIILEKQKYGFIGGTIGNLSQDILIFSGNIDDHPNKIEIENFIKQKEVEIIYLSKEKIIDVGTIICLNSK